MVRAARARSEVGPLGAIAGAVSGAAMGASSGWAADKSSEDEAEVDAELDDAIGVGSGSIGVATVPILPSKVGAPSAAAAGVSDESADSEAEGPMQVPPA